MGLKFWSLALWEHHRLLLSENRALRKIFGPKTEEVKGELRKMHNEELPRSILLSQFYNVDQNKGAGVT